MSYPGVDPSDANQTNPVGTQERSEGSVKTVELPSNTPNALQAASQSAHDEALREESRPPLTTEELNKAVAEAVSDMFQVTDAWRPRNTVKFKIECPSGQTALVKHLDTMDLLEYDLIEELDFFTRRLFPSAVDPSGSPLDAAEQAEEGLWVTLRDPEKRMRFFDMTGRLMAAASIDPSIVHDGVALQEDQNGTKTCVFGYQVDSVEEQIKLFGKPIPMLKERQAYSGPIDFGDRMAFFSELNKPLVMIEPFRPESAVVLQDLERSEGHGGEAE